MHDPIVKIFIAIGVLIALWFAAERFSPDPLITKICQIILFILALIVVITKVLPLVGIG